MAMLAGCKTKLVNERDFGLLIQAVNEAMEHATVELLLEVPLSLGLAMHCRTALAWYLISGLEASAFSSGTQCVLNSDMQESSTTVGVREQCQNLHEQKRLEVEQENAASQKRCRMRMR